ncbi:unnamed protein product [Boreogadus saida]
MEVRVRVRVEVPSHRWLFWAHCGATAAAKLHPAHPDSPATAMSSDTSPLSRQQPRPPVSRMEGGWAASHILSETDWTLGLGHQANPSQGFASLLQFCTFNTNKGIFR